MEVKTTWCNYFYFKVSDQCRSKTRLVERPAQAGKQNVPNSRFYNQIKWFCELFCSCNKENKNNKKISPVTGWVGKWFYIGTSGTWSERAGLLGERNKYCRHQREMLHLFNVPFPKWNPCNPADMETSRCIPPFGIWSELKLFTNVWCLTFIESGL